MDSYVFTCGTVQRINLEPTLTIIEKAVHQCNALLHLLRTTQLNEDLKIVMTFTVDELDEIDKV